MTTQEVGGFACPFVHLPSKSASSGKRAIGSKGKTMRPRCPIREKRRPVLMKKQDSSRLR